MEMFDGSLSKVEEQGRDILGPHVSSVYTVARGLAVSYNT